MDRSMVVKWTKEGDMTILVKGRRYSYQGVPMWAYRNTEAYLRMGWVGKTFQGLKAYRIGGYRKGQPRHGHTYMAGLESR